jgi:hypothetical protein
MGYGMGKNTPIILSFGKSNYEALIERHGQFIRWRIAMKCPCTDKHTRQPDPACPHCGGLGFRYSYQPQILITEEVMVSDDTNIVEVPEEYAGCALDKVLDYGGREYLAKKFGTFITLEKSPAKGAFLTVIMTMETVKTLEKSDCENAGGGYYRVNGLRYRKDGIEGIHYTAPADIIRIGKITDAGGREYEASELRTDLFHIVQHTETVEVEGVEVVRGIPITEPLAVSGVEYIPPFVFALFSQNLSKEDSEIMTEIKGDAVLTFPNSCDVSEGDILTALSGTHTQKEVMKRTDEANDTIGAYFVTKIVSCIGKTREYKEGDDFILVGTNYLRWLCKDAPDREDSYSITYQLCPTYKVVKNIPQIRTSENQRLPKKAIVQYYGTYGEQRRANQQ